MSTWAVGVVEEDVLVVGVLLLAVVAAVAVGVVVGVVVEEESFAGGVSWVAPKFGGTGAYSVVVGGHHGQMSLGFTRTDVNVHSGSTAHATASPISQAASTMRPPPSGADPVWSESSVGLS